MAQNNPKMDHVNDDHCLRMPTAMLSQKAQQATVLAACDSKNDVEKLKRSLRNGIKIVVLRHQRNQGSEKCRGVDQKSQQRKPALGCGDL